MVARFEISDEFNNEVLNYFLATVREQIIDSIIIKKKERGKIV